VAEMRDAKGVPVPVVWASGSNGAILKSIDEGKTWKRLHVSGSDTLDFRGIVAFSEKIAYVMSSGEGEKSRIYKTTDGRRNLEIANTRQAQGILSRLHRLLFRKNCVALSAPVDGKFRLFSTTAASIGNALPATTCPQPCQMKAPLPPVILALRCRRRRQRDFLRHGRTCSPRFHTKDRGHTWTVRENADCYTAIWRRRNFLPCF